MNGLKFPTLTMEHKNEGTRKQVAKKTMSCQCGGQPRTRQPQSDDQSSLPNACSHPHAVMIKPCNTYIAVPTVHRSWRLVVVTMLAVLPSSRQWIRECQTPLDNDPGIPVRHIQEMITARHGQHNARGSRKRAPALPGAFVRKVNRGETNQSHYARRSKPVRTHHTPTVRIRVQFR